MATRAVEKRLVDRRGVWPFRPVMNRSREGCRFGRQGDLCSMTVQAPAHGQWCVLDHPLHGLDRAMAGRAGHIAGNVAGMAEEHKIWKVVNLDPANRSLLGEGLSKTGKISGLSCQLSVTVHAYRHRRDAGVSAGFCARMTVQAGDALTPCMECVREGDRLFWFVATCGANPSQ